MTNKMVSLTMKNWTMCMSNSAYKGECLKAMKIIMKIEATNTWRNAIIIKKLKKK